MIARALLFTLDRQGVQGARRRQVRLRSDFGRRRGRALRPRYGKWQRGRQGWKCTEVWGTGRGRESERLQHRAASTPIKWSDGVERARLNRCVGGQTRVCGCAEGERNGISSSVVNHTESSHYESLACSKGSPSGAASACELYSRILASLTWFSMSRALLMCARRARARCALVLSPLTLLCSHLSRALVRSPLTLLCSRLSLRLHRKDCCTSGYTRVAACCFACCHPDS